MKAPPPVAAKAPPPIAEIEAYHYTGSPGLYSEDAAPRNPWLPAAKARAQAVSKPRPAPPPIPKNLFTESQDSTSTFRRLRHLRLRLHFQRLRCRFQKRQVDRLHLQKLRRLSPLPRKSIESLMRRYAKF